MNAVEQAVKTISDAISYPKSPEVREAFKTLRAALSIETAHEDDKSAGGPKIGAPIPSDINNSHSDNIDV